MANAAAHVPDEVHKWWKTFNNGGAVEDEPMVDSDSDFEQGEQGAEENAGVVAGECHRKVDPDADAPGGTEGSSGAARDCDVARDEIPEDGHFQLQGALQGMKTEAAAGRNLLRANRWGETFNNGGAVEYEPMVDPDSDFEQGEQGEEEEEDAGECDRKVDPDAHAPAPAPAGRDGSSGAPRDCDGVLQGMKSEAAAGRNAPRATAAETQNEEGQEEYVSEDNYAGGEFQAKKRKAAVTAGKLQTVGSGTPNKNAHGEFLRAENQMLRLQLVRKTKELVAEQIRRLELELHFMKKENELLKNQLEELKAENEYYKKTAKPQKTRRLCRFCKEYADHDYRNCPERRASACSGEDDGSN